MQLINWEEIRSVSVYSRFGHTLLHCFYFELDIWINASKAKDIFFRLDLKQIKF